MRDDVVAALHRLLVDLESPESLDEWAGWREGPPLEVVVVRPNDEREADLKKAA
jgi:hypothetical protein